MKKDIPNILNDPLNIVCISLAMMSKSDKERYGSCLVKQGKIIGIGWNRAVAHSSFKLEMEIEREIIMGYANHSEIEAMNSALRKDQDIEGGDIYCSGYFPSSDDVFPYKNTFFIKKGAFFTCVRCPPHMARYGIGMIYVPTLSGWQGLSVQDALEDARKYTNGTYEKRVNSVKSIFPLELMEQKLLESPKIDSLERALPIAVDELAHEFGL